MSGALQCFCQQYKNDNGYSACRDHIFELEIQGHKASGDICSDWAYKSWLGFSYSTIVSSFVVVINFILKMIIIYLITIV
jgi:hypothetical protein